MKDNPNPNPARVAIVQQITHCTEQTAEETINHLDKYDLEQQTTSSASNSEQGNGYASLPEILPVGISALVAAGYSKTESTLILQTLFNGLAAQHGGKRIYLPKQDRLLSRFEKIQIILEAA